MKNKGKKYCAVLMAGVLCFTALSACSAAESPASSTSSTSSETPDISQGTQEESVDSSNIYEFASMGMTATLPEALMERMEQGEITMFTYEINTEDDSALQYGLLSWSIIPEGESEETALQGDYFEWINGLECIGTLGVYHSDILDQLNELTRCDEHQELGESADGTYKYYLSTNTTADEELTTLLGQIQITIQEMTASQQSSDFDTPDNEFTNTSLGEFTTQDINGQTYTQEIFQDYELTMVNVFTTWCSPCVAEIPDLEKLRQTMADQGVNVIGVVLDVLNEKGEIEEDSLERAKLLAEQTGATYPFLLPDPTYMNGRLIGIEAFPETFFVDKNGNIVGETYSGSGGLEDWIEVVEKELANLKEGV